MSKPVFSKSALLDWAKSKDPKEEVCPSFGLTCFLAQYGRFLGFENAIGGNRELYEGSELGNTVGKVHPIIDMPMNAIYHKKWRNSKGECRNNFGNLVEALEHPELIKHASYYEIPIIATPLYWNLSDFAPSSAI